MPTVQNGVSCLACWLVLYHIGMFNKTESLSWSFCDFGAWRNDDTELVLIVYSPVWCVSLKKKKIWFNIVGQLSEGCKLFSVLYKQMTVYDRRSLDCKKMHLDEKVESTWEWIGNLHSICLPTLTQGSVHLLRPLAFTGVSSFWVPWEALWRCL